MTESDADVEFVYSDELLNITIVPPVVRNNKSPRPCLVWSHCYSVVCRLDCL